MIEKDKELIKSLAALLNKLKKLFHFNAIFSHQHDLVGEDNERTDVADIAHKNVNFVGTAHTNDATGENAAGSILKKENLNNQDN